MMMMMMIMIMMIGSWAWDHLYICAMSNLKVEGPLRSRHIADGRLISCHATGVEPG
jgi:hypothetical protein